MRVKAAPIGVITQWSSCFQIEFACNPVPPPPLPLALCLRSRRSITIRQFWTKFNSVPIDFVVLQVKGYCITIAKASKDWLNLNGSSLMEWLYYNEWISITERERAKCSNCFNLADSHILHYPARHLEEITPTILNIITTPLVRSDHHNGVHSIVVKVQIFWKPDCMDSF